MLFPDPEIPTRPTRTPCGTVRFIFENTNADGRDGYAKFTFLNVTEPLNVSGAMHLLRSYVARVVPSPLNGLASIAGTRSMSLKIRSFAASAFAWSPMNTAP